LIKKLFRKYSELAFWIAALVALGCSNPAEPSQYVLCPFRLMGFKWCPGCGIGHSIAWLLHGDIKNSLHAHWLGIPALIIIVYRIIILFKANVLERGNTARNIFETRS